jgi:hypothetical protein
MVTNISKKRVASIFRIEVRLEIWIVYIGGWRPKRMGKEGRKKRSTERPIDIVKKEHRATNRYCEEGEG